MNSLTHRWSAASYIFTISYGVVSSLNRDWQLLNSFQLNLLCKALRHWLNNLFMDFWMLTGPLIGPLCTFLYRPILGETTQVVEDCEASICLVFLYERDFQGLCVTCWLSVMSYGYERCVFLYPIWWKYIIDFTAKHSLSTQTVTRPANGANHYVYLQVQVQSNYTSRVQLKDDYLSVQCRSFFDHCYFFKLYRINSHKKRIWIRLINSWWLALTFWQRYTTWNV